MNVVLINITRFGDLLQSQAAVSDLVRQGCRVCLVCLDNFSGAAALMRGLSMFAPLPGSKLLGPLCADAVETPFEESWPLALSRLEAWRETLAEAFPVDAVLNLTPSLPARLLARCIAGEKECFGFALDEFGYSVSGNPWAAFLQSAGAARGVSPFNVADLFRKAARLPESLRQAESAGGAEYDTFPAGDSALARPDKDRTRRMGAVITAEAPAGSTRFVGFQLGASEERRRLPVSVFAELGERLYREEGLVPVLFGSKAEMPLAEEYEQAAGAPFVSLCGRTGLEDLAAALTHISLLVTNDTGTMHLAAGLGLPVLGIFLATAQPFDTGPYLAGSCTVEPGLPCHPCGFGIACPHDHICRNSIPADLLASLALSRLRSGEWNMGENPSKARVWLSRAGEDGFMELVSLSGHESEERGVWMAVLRRYLGRFIDRDRNTPFTAPPFSEPLLLPKEAASAILRETAALSGLLELLRGQGAALLSRNLPFMKDKFMNTWRRITQELRQSPRFAALALVWVEETQAENRPLPRTLELAEQFAAFVAAVREEVLRSVEPA